MKEKHLTNWGAIGIGCIVFIGASILMFLLPVSVYFLYVINIFIMAVLPLSIIGALTGKYFSKTRTHVWIGAVLGAILGLWLFFSIASNMALD
jgi:hypothetical protein